MLSSTRRFFLVSLSTAVAILALAMTAFGQASATAGAINGTVTDQAGASISGASIKARNLDTGLERSATTEESGRFELPLLPLGKYEVIVNANGFGELKQTGITLRVGDELDLKIELKASGTSEVVNVVEEAPIADPDKTEVATTIGQKSIQDLPINGRRWSSFVLLVPDVTLDSSFGLISFRGISGLLNNNTIDGTDNNQAFFSEERGRTRLNYVVSEESIQEFQVNTSDYSAEFGRSAGGVTNAVTKSGTNDIHGSGFYYIRDTSLNARNPLNFLTTGLTSSGQPILEAINPPDRRQQFGGTIGGPIIKDKLFFFFSYDEQLRNFPINAQPGSPTFFTDCTNPQPGLSRGPASACSAASSSLLSQTGVSPRNGNQWIFFPKVDWHINQNNLFTASYNYLKWSSLNGIQTQPVVAFAQSGNGSDDVRVDSLNLRLVSTLTPSLLNELRLQYARDFEFEPTNAPNEVGATVEGFQIGPPTFLPRVAFPDEKKLEWVDNVSIVHGAHTIKFGVDLLRTDDYVNSLTAEFGDYTYGTKTGPFGNLSGVANFGVDLANPGDKDYTSYKQAFGPATLGFNTWDIGAFIQDEWRIRSNVTLNYGLRYQYIVMPDTVLPNPQIPQTTSLPEDSTDFGPRIGVAWDILGDTKTVLRAGYGIYYGRIENSSINNALIDTGATGSVLTYTIFPTTSGAPAYPNRLASAPAGAAAAKPSVFFFGPDMKTPLIHQADLAIERQITSNMSVSVSYLLSRGTRLPNFFDTNLLPPNRTQPFLVLGSTGSVVNTVDLPIFTSPRPNLNFNAMMEEVSNVSSWYNAVVFQINKRFSHGVQFLAHFTYSKATDLNQTSTTFSASSPTSLNQFNLQGEDGRSAFDVPRRFVASAVWDMPFFRNSESMAARSVLGGWKLAPIVTIQDGFRLSESVNGNLFGFTSPDGFVVPSSFPGSSLNGSGGTNRVPFEPRNNFQLPALENVDLRLAKQFRISERTNLEFIAEAFNLFNHTLVFGANTSQYNLIKVQPNGAPCPTTGSCSPALPAFSPNVSFLAPNADQSTLFRERQMQLALKFHF
jgi:hypothetical protein